MKIVYLATVLAVLVLAQSKIFPPPVVEEYHRGELTLGSVCNVFHFPSEHLLVRDGYYFGKILKRLNNNLECPRQLVFTEGLIPLKATEKNEMKDESYEIRIDQNGIEIIFGDYSGYVYALESLSQLIKKNTVPFAHIRDEPLLSYRGIMIDSARHYLSVASIKRLITSMPLSKLNILHWHIVDDQSFPLVLDSHPELAAGSKYSDGQVYTKKDVAEIIALAEKNAVQVVPEIDTPAHVRSWGQSEQWKAKDIAIKCHGGTGYNGQFDVSIPQVFTLAKDVVQEVDKLFTNSPYIHLGGDEVSSNCWNLRPAIQDFMAKNNIANYGELQMYWRKQIKSVLSKDRKVVFWRNDAKDVTTTADDVLQYWGSQNDTSRSIASHILVTSNTTSKIVLSPSDILYLNKGHGNLWLNASQGQYSVWRQIYQGFVVFPKGVDQSRILGAVACLWGEVSNEDTLENNLWMRATAFASRVWSEKIQKTHEIVASLVDIQYSLYKMDVDASPVTSEFCEHKPEVCFPPSDSPNPSVLEM